MARKKTEVTTRTKTTRAPAKKVEVRNVDADGIEEVKEGMSFEDGIVLTTTVLMVGCLVLLIVALGRYPG